MRPAQLESGHDNGEPEMTKTVASFATVDPFEVIDVNISDYPNVATWASKLMKEPFYTKVHGSYKETLDAAMAG